ncbi:MAG: hypothetical protein ABI806_29445 [Candidatus Solibacter sp.]
MKAVLVGLLVSAAAFGQALSQATGDDFTIAVWNDVHAENVATYWTQSTDWLLGASGAGPGGAGTCGAYPCKSAIAYWNIVSINGVGDYTTACTTVGTACNNAWNNDFKPDWLRQLATAFYGIWPGGNHDIVGPYATDVLGMTGVHYGSTPSQQYVNIDRTTSSGTIKLGIMGVDWVDNMALLQPSRIWADSVLSASESNRQWMFLRHVGTDTVNSPNPAPAYVYPADGNAGWYTSASEGIGVNTGVQLRDDFYMAEPKVYWGVHGHLKYVARLSFNAADGHTVNVTGNLGASGGKAGWITLLKFRPSHNDIQWAVYIWWNGAPNTAYSGPYTWAWTPQYSAASAARSCVDFGTGAGCGGVKFK